MGATSARIQSTETTFAFLRRELERDYIPGTQTGFRILAEDSTTEAFFAVLERTDHTDGAVQRLAVICPYARCGYFLTWKTIAEDMGPSQIAPRAFLEQLQRLIPEPPNDWAHDWRAKCQRAYAANSNARQSS